MSNMAQRPLSGSRPDTCSPLSTRSSPLPAALAPLALESVTMIPMMRTTKLLLVAAALAAPALLPAATNYTLVGWNNLGMHCIDSDYSVFSVLPPYNTINAQVIQGINGIATLLTNGIGITYRAVADPSGSINTTSAGKGNFYDYMGSIIGATLPVDAGLPVPNPPGIIYHMPGSGNVPQPMTVESNLNWFVAYGIPIFPTDDTGKPNQYPMMRLVATNTLGQVLAGNDIVLPVSDEMNCRLCHLSGSGPAARPAAGWVNDPDPGRDYRLNILRLHDERQWASNATLYAAALASKPFNPAGLCATVTVDKKPFICASCHLSEALPFPQLLGIPQLTTAVHGHHASVVDPRSTNSLTLDSEANRLACYTCHPGSVTRCLRGAMGKAVNPVDGSMAMQCQSCHGNMSAVGDPNRVGWYKEPTCQACHTGDAVTNSGLMRYTSVFTNGAMRVPANTRFATTDNVPFSPYNLYRFSAGHGGVKCSGCHGSTHAEFPSAFTNDNVASQQHQGHAGMLMECDRCHAAQPSTIDQGPHGMHPIAMNTPGSWADSHNDILEQSRYDRTKCRVCHGASYEGTSLSRAQADRTVSAGKFGSVTFWRGYQISCYRCHDGPDSSDPSSHGIPTVNNVSAATATGVSVAMTLTGSGGTGWRIVSQPTNGTVAISNNNLAVYFPGQGFAGTDTFTFAASNGYNDSATLGVGTVTVTNTYSLGDAIPDWWRRLHFGCITCPEAAATADPDGDGMNNYQEFIAGTDPKDPRSRLRVFALTQSGGSTMLSFESLLGNRYGVQYRDNLTLGNWNSLSTNVWGRTDSTTVTDTNTAGPVQRFYRVLSGP